MLRQDYIGRLIEQLGQALAKIAKLTEQAQTDEAEREIAAAEQTLGLPRGLELFDARSAVSVVGNGDKVVLAALLLERRAAVSDARGNAKGAARARQRAQELLRHARPHELCAEAEALTQRLSSRASGA